MRFVWVCVLFLGLAVLVRGQELEMAITFDDLPAGNAYKNPVPLEDLTAGLLQTLAKSEVKVTGFVNEGKLYVDDQFMPKRLRLIMAWLDAGHELGNHTFSHQSLHQISVEDYTADILAGEKHLRPLLNKFGQDLVWFRHPFLHTGLNAQARGQVESYLAQHNYRVAPVTIDNSDWLFASAYDRALLEGDEAMREKIGKSYVSYMTAQCRYYVDQSKSLFGRDIKHILLVHASNLNADWFGELVTALRDMGFSFISLEDAVKDPAYQSEDTWFGKGGISWLHRWALTQGKRGAFFAGEQETPKWVQEYAERKEWVPNL